MSECVPPVPFSPSLICQRLFKHFSPDSYLILTTRYERQAGSRQFGEPLPCRHYYADIGSSLAGRRRWAFLRELGDVVPLVRKGLRIIGEEAITGLLVYPTSAAFLLASHELARLSKIPLYVYMLDLYAAAHSRGLGRILGVPIERLGVKGAEVVFVMSEVLQDYYCAKYGVAPVLLRHPIELRAYQDHGGRAAPVPVREQSGACAGSLSRLMGGRATGRE